MLEDLEVMIHDWWLDLDTIRDDGRQVGIDARIDDRRLWRRGHLTFTGTIVTSVTDSDATAQLLIGELYLSGDYLVLVSLGPRSELHLRVDPDWSYVVCTDIALIRRRPSFWSRNL